VVTIIQRGGTDKVVNHSEADEINKPGCRRELDQNKKVETKVNNSNNTTWKFTTNQNRKCVNIRLPNPASVTTHTEVFGEMVGREHPILNTMSNLALFLAPL
jgi:hypothetical protein